MRRQIQRLKRQARVERVKCKTDESSHERGIVVWKIENVYFVFKFIAQIEIEIGIVSRLRLLQIVKFCEKVCGVFCWLRIEIEMEKKNFFFYCSTPTELMICQ